MNIEPFAHVFYNYCVTEACAVYFHVLRRDFWGAGFRGLCSTFPACMFAEGVHSPHSRSMDTNDTLADATGSLPFHGEMMHVFWTGNQETEKLLKTDLFCWVTTNVVNERLGKPNIPNCVFSSCSCSSSHLSSKEDFWKELLAIFNPATENF